MNLLIVYRHQQHDQATIVHEERKEAQFDEYLVAW
jgi:hypothetical protein